MQSTDCTKLGSALLYGAYALERGATCTSSTFPTYAERTTIRARTANQVFLRKYKKLAMLTLLCCSTLKISQIQLLVILHFNAKCHDQYEFALNLIQLATIFNLFPQEVIQ